MKKTLFYIAGLLFAFIAGVGVGGSSSTPTSKPVKAVVEVTQIPTSTLAPTSSAPSPTVAIQKPTTTPIPPTTKPTATPYPTTAPQTYTAPVDTSGGYACNCSKTCSQMSSCAEAQYQLNTCGCSARDGDHDGVACDSQCQ